MLAFIFFTQASGLPIPAAGKERHPDGVSDAMAISAILDQQNQQAELCSYTTIFLDDLARDTDYITSVSENKSSFLKAATQVTCSSELDRVYGET